MPYCAQSLENRQFSHLDANHQTRGVVRVGRLREAIRRVNPAIPEVARATIREYRTVRFETSTP